MAIPSLAADKDILSSTCQSIQLKVLGLADHLGGVGWGGVGWGGVGWGGVGWGGVGWGGVGWGGVGWGGGVSHKGT